jgi:hypothetical protein
MRLANGFIYIGAFKNDRMEGPAQLVH